MTYLTLAQVTKLLEPIRPARVGEDPNGRSHVEAYEIRAHLTRLFGFGRWSADVIEQVPVFEHSEQRQNRKGEDYTAWTCCYRSLLRLTVHAPDGTVLATYTEGATGDATNQPVRAEAHDMALKTSESQALKRAAANLGDQFGLSLYRKGSMSALVQATWLMPDPPPEAGEADEPPEGVDPQTGEISEQEGTAA